MTYILGISCYYHDSAAVLLKNGVILHAVQEERFTRKKHDPDFPTEAIRYILQTEKITLSQIEHIVFYDKPLLKFERLLETYIASVPSGFSSFKTALPLWIKDKLFLKSLLKRSFRKIDKQFSAQNLKFVEHHLSHAASAFYASNFKEAIVLTLDGVGEWATSTVCIGNNNDLEIKKEIHFPHSLGLLYSAFTYYLGFKVNSGEYKIMGLAPYGNPIYKDTILEKIVEVKDDGSFRLNQEFFDYSVGLKMINKKFERLFGEKTRKTEQENLTQFHMNVASSIQKVLEEIVLKLVKSLVNEYQIENLCLAGGVALNCVANGKILASKYVKNIWVQPASGDAGGALGCALYQWFKELKNERKVGTKDIMQGSLLGPSFSNDEIQEDLNSLGANYTKVSNEELLRITSEKISEKNAIGWFQNKMEFGPRALGSRSIIADPTCENMQKNLNLKVKFRESFRPFAPAVLEEDASRYFNLNVKSPYMLLVADINKSLILQMSKKDETLFGIEKLNIKRSSLPAITHVDYSARIQTVNKETNGIFYELLLNLKKLTGNGVVINTSFNVRGEPIVMTPKDAFRCFMGTGLDYLCIGNFILNKKDQNPLLKEDYKNLYELD